MAFFSTFMIMFAFWILLSGKFDIFHLSLGFISSLLIAHFSKDLLFKEKIQKGALSEAFRFMFYIPWLIYQVFVANLIVAYIALHPRMMDHINPEIIWFKSKLKQDIALVTLGNSITLTPGTITVRIVGGEFYVHSLAPKFAENMPGEMEERIGKIFNEDMSDHG